MNSQTQTFESNFTGTKNLQSEQTKTQSQFRGSDSETLTEKDLIVSNFDGIDFLPDQPAKSDSPEISQALRFKKNHVQSSLDVRLTTKGPEEEHEEQPGHLLSTSQHVSKRFRDITAEMAAVQQRNQETQEHNAQFLENSAIMYACLASYAGYYFSENENQGTTNSILNKCLEGGKVNYPDLFLRFMD